MIPEGGARTAGRLAR